MGMQLVLTKNSVGTSSVIRMNPDVETIFLDLVVANAVLSREESDLVFSFDDGTQITLNHFYSLYSRSNIPDFDIEGTVVEGKMFFDAMGISELLPAAGHRHSGAMGSGISDDATVTELIGGLEALNGGMTTNENLTFDGDFGHKYDDSVKKFEHENGSANEGVISPPSKLTLNFTEYTDTTYNYIANDGNIFESTYVPIPLRGTDSDDEITGALLTGNNPLILAGAGDDTITITTMSGGTIKGEEGADTISVTDMSGGEIVADGDTVNIGTMSGQATITSSLGIDYITVDKMLGGAITASTGDEIFVTSLTGTAEIDVDGAELVNIGTMSGQATITSSLGIDYITVDKMLGGTIIANIGDEISITNSMSDSEIYIDGTTVDIATMNSGKIDAGNSDNANTIHVDVMRGDASITGGRGDDVYNIAAMSGDASITDILGKSVINIDTFTAGIIITGDDGAEIVVRNLMSGGDISMGAGADIFSVASMIGGSVDGGAGEDTMHFTKAFNKGFEFEINENTYTIQDGNGNMGSVSNFEKIQFSDFSDNVSFDVLNGLDVDLGDGDDTIIVSGDIDNSSIFGGDGDDTITVLGDFTGNIIDGGAGYDRLIVGNDSYKKDDAGHIIFDSSKINNIEVIQFGSGDDTLNFSNNVDDLGFVIDGGDGKDVIFASQAGSIMDGGAGVDYISGGAGNDVIVYDSQDFRIEANGGIDVLLVRDGEEFDTNQLEGMDMEIAITGLDSDYVITPDVLESLGVTITGDSVSLDGWEDNQDGTYTHIDHDFILTTSSDFTEISIVEISA